MALKLKTGALCALAIAAMLAVGVPAVALSPASPGGNSNFGWQWGGNQTTCGSGRVCYVENLSGTLNCTLTGLCAQYNFLGTSAQWAGIGATTANSFANGDQLGTSAERTYNNQTGTSRPNCSYHNGNYGGTKQRVNVGNYVALPYTGVFSSATIPSNWVC